MEPKPMERRIIFAVLLISAAMLLSNVLFPPPPPEEQAAAGADSTEVVAPTGTAPTIAPLAAAPAGPADTIAVTSGRYRYLFSTRGASLIGAELLDYPSYTQPGESVQLAPAGGTDFLSQRLVVGSDTVDLSRALFQASDRSIALSDSTPRPLTLIRYRVGSKV